MVDNQHWLDRWQENRIGFHEDAVNRHLQSHFTAFGLNRGDPVFLPLCGKAQDISWIAAQGYKVIGIEISQLAVEAFFTENELDYKREATERFTVYRAGNITLYQGDFYDLQRHDLKDCKLVYDRAALIAVERHDRSRYCEQMLSIMPSTSNMLLITLVYNQAEMLGPPFAVPAEEVYQHYQDAFSIQLLETSDILDERPRWREVGLTALAESVFRLDR